MHDEIFAQCRAALPGWADLTVDDVTFAAPKGFSSFTMTIRAQRPAAPPAIFYRRLEGKENAILDTETERRVFLLLGEAGIAAHCPRYDANYRLEACYDGRTLTNTSLGPGRVDLLPNQQAVVCVGSVGQPRDGDENAKYIIWDADAASLEVRFIRYDIGAAAEKIIAAGLPRAHADRLWCR